MTDRPAEDSSECRALWDAILGGAAAAGRENLVLAKRNLGPDLREYLLHCPLVAANCRPGQFVVVRGDERGERIPLTIADFDRQAGTITLVMRIVGAGTRLLDAVGEGGRLRDVAGPLGHPSEIAAFGHVVCIGGGVGIAPVYPIQRALKGAGNRITCIIGARSRDLIFWEDRMRASADEFHLLTDDGSAGVRGIVTSPLASLLAAGAPVNRVIAIGPPVMMKAVAAATRERGIPTIVSLNSIMVDGTGMCGGCRVSVGGVTRFTCVDGPEFDAHQVDFDLLVSRLNTYRREEEQANAFLSSRPGGKP